MWVVHEPEHIPKGIDHRGRDEPSLAVCEFLVLLGPHGLCLLERPGNIVDMPVDDCTTRAGLSHLGRIATIDDPQLVLVIAEPVLDVDRVVRVRTFEVRFGAEQLRVPLAGCRTSSDQ